MSEKITVLIPMYNREKYIKECIDSIINQTYTNLHIIVYDDGSTDNSVNIVKNFTDSRIELITGKSNKGVGFARNELLKACKTDLAVWQDSDDLAHIKKIEMQYAVIKDRYDIFVVTQFGRFKENNHFNVKNKKMFNLNEIPLEDKGDHEKAFGTIMFRMTENIPKFDERITIGGVDTLWKEVMYENYSDIIIRKMLYFVRFHNNRIGADKRKPENKEKVIRNNKIFAQEMAKSKARKRVRV